MAVLGLFRPFKELYLSQVIPDIVIPSMFRSSNWSSYIWLPFIYFFYNADFRLSIYVSIPAQPNNIQGGFFFLNHAPKFKLMDYLKFLNGSYILCHFEGRVELPDLYLIKYYWDDETKKRGEAKTSFWWRKMKESVHMYDLSVNGSTKIQPKKWERGGGHVNWNDLIQGRKR
jgi:hypothetical protein